MDIDRSSWCPRYSEITLAPRSSPTVPPKFRIYKQSRPLSVPSNSLFERISWHFCWKLRSARQCRCISHPFQAKTAILQADLRTLGSQQPQHKSESIHETTRLLSGGANRLHSCAQCADEQPHLSLGTVAWWKREWRCHFVGSGGLLSF